MKEIKQALLSFLLKSFNYSHFVLVTYLRSNPLHFGSLVSLKHMDYLNLQISSFEEIVFIYCL